MAVKVLFLDVGSGCKDLCHEVIHMRYAGGFFVLFFDNKM